MEKPIKEEEGRTKKAARIKIRNIAFCMAKALEERRKEEEEEERRLQTRRQGHSLLHSKKCVKKRRLKTGKKSKQNEGKNEKEEGRLQG
jgi:hypothetical protein